MGKSSKKSLTEIKAMAKGYQEMGELNLQISDEFFLLETEGERLNEMDTKESKNKAN